MHLLLNQCPKCKTILAAVTLNIPVCYKGVLTIFSVNGKYCPTCRIPYFVIKRLNKLDNDIVKTFDEIDIMRKEQI